MNRRTLALLLILTCAAVGVATLTHADDPPALPPVLAAQLALVEREPANAGALNDLGNLYVALGRYDDAEASFERSLEAAPELTTARFNLALLLTRQGKRLSALRQLDRLLDRHPDHAWAHYQRGVILEGWGFRNRAIKAYARAFALDRRLSFPEVNPKVLDNRLLAESLLAANAEPEQRLQAPARYEDPARIAALLLDRPLPGGDAAANAEGTATSEAAAHEASGQRPPGQPETTAATGGSRAGAGGRAPIPGTPVTGTAVREGGTTVRSWVAAEDEGATGTEPPAAGRGRQDRPVLPGGLDPGIFSTGRLHLRLVTPDIGAG